MKELIEEALRVSCLLWNADIEKVRNNTSRLKNNVRAKRMFVYYIYSFLEVSYVDIKNYIIGFNHASSIYHVKEFNKDLDNDPDVKKIFKQFMHKMNLYSVYGSGYMEKRKEIEKLKQELIDFINK
jgi:hypothetical protein|tara:strand:- start:1715 stop:2092 length:378 start_codon:yes stop_codon:yes gene_type:complete